MKKIFDKGINAFKIIFRKLFFTKKLFFAKIFDYFQMLGIHILPVHFYSPIPDTRTLQKNIELWSKELPLIGVDLNIEGQKKLPENVCFPFQDEYMSFPLEKNEDPLQYYLNNDSFGFVSGQMYYSMIRYFKPEKIIEVGSGNSTLVAVNALKKNANEGYNCEFVAIDPYPPTFLKNADIKLVKEKVENIDLNMFTKTLSKNDILFIDSTHTVRISGDVNFLILEVLPALKKGVIVHIHDIQFPFEYFKSTVLKDHLFFQEQYLVQAFLTYNQAFKILWCASYMHYKYSKLMAEFFYPYPKNRVPTSLYIQKIA